MTHFLLGLATAIVTTSPEAYTKSALPVLKAELAKRHADAAVDMPAPLTLRVRGKDGHELTLSLERAWGMCQRDVSTCPPATEEYLARAADQLAMSLVGEPPIDRKQLRVVVRDVKYIEALKKAQPKLVAHPAAGTLWLVTLLDFPTASRALTDEDLAKLKLTAAAAEAAGLGNVKKQVGSVDKLTQTLPERGIGYLNPPGYYNSGLLAGAADWAGLAKKMKGQLVVSVPNDETVLYTDSAQPGGVAALTAITAKMFGEASRPVSTQLVQWTASGWKAYAP
jgi:uncharacterized protein YtpQ (UPF0354 family)